MKKATGIEKRSAILYARVKPSSKAYITVLADRHEISESQALDWVIEAHKCEREAKKSASHKK